VAQPTWSTLSPAVSPPPLKGAAGAYDADTKTVVVFGGAKGDGTLSHDTWIWDGSMWLDVPSAPPARRGASMAFDPTLHQLLLFGGQGAGGTLLSDTWAWNGAVWVPIVASSSPSARQGAAMALDSSGHLVLFGGTGVPPAPPVPSTTTTSTTQPTPPPGPEVLGDTWVWDGNGWRSPPTPIAPPPRSGAVSTYDSQHAQTVLFGGSSSPAGATTAASQLADTWTWSGAAWTPSTPPTNAPARVGAVADFDADLAAVVVFSGSTGTAVLNDTWQWDGGTWAQVPAATPPAARQGAVGAYDAASRQFVVFGGATGTGSVLGDTVVLASHPPVAISPPTSVPSSTGATTRPAVQPPAGRPGAALSPSSTAPTSAAGSRPQSAGQAPAGALLPPLVATSHTVHRGELVELKGSGFQPGATVTVTFHSTPVVVGKTLADAAGKFSLTVAVPATASAGEHHFEAIGETTTGQMATLVTAVRVVAFNAHPGAATAVEKAVMVGVAIGIPIVTWLVLGLLERRRRPAPTS